MADALPFSTVLPEIGWPAVPSAAGQALLALQFQLHRSQWWSAEMLAQHQFRQLRELVGHAVAGVPFYRGHLKRASIFAIGGVNPTSFARWPILTRADLRSAAEALGIVGGSDPTLTTAARQVRDRARRPPLPERHGSPCRGCQAGGDRRR